MDSTSLSLLGSGKTKMHRYLLLHIHHSILRTKISIVYSFPPI